MSDFVSRCLSGDALLDEIDDAIDEWHDGASTQELHEYLGMDTLEYELWLNDPEILPLVVLARREERQVPEILEEFATLPIAARANGPNNAVKLMQWLDKQDLWK